VGEALILSITKTLVINIKQKHSIFTIKKLFTPFSTIFHQNNLFETSLELPDFPLIKIHEKPRVITLDLR
jgi:hypothetical protein